jgi:purine-cytosine permease-like protein
MQTERILVGLVLLAGFLLLRRRAKGLDDSERGRALRGTILFLAPVLIGGRWLFEKLPYGLYENLAIEMVGLVVVIAVAGFVFMKPGNSEREPGNR